MVKLEQKINPDGRWLSAGRFTRGFVGRSAVSISGSLFGMPKDGIQIWQHRSMN